MDRSLARCFAIAAVSLAALASSGCSISASSESISDSISSPFEWLSDSSGSSSPDGGASFAYLRDVETLSRAFADASGARSDAAGFLRELGRTAEAHGISDWEAYPETFAAIGEGWRRAGLAPDAVERLSAELFGAGSNGAAGVLRAYARTG